MITFKLNGKSVSSDMPDDTPLLWVIRDEFDLKGTKYSCGIAQCGSCTVHLDGKAIRSCAMPVSVAAGRNITTIEGLDEHNQHPLQKAWVAEQVPQCGYCQSGQIMQAAQLLNENANPSDEDIVTHMNGILCRCMSYVRIKKAIKRAVATTDGEGQS